MYGSSDAAEIGFSAFTTAGDGYLRILTKRENQRTTKPQQQNMLLQSPENTLIERLKRLRGRQTREDNDDTKRRPHQHARGA